MPANHNIPHTEAAKKKMSVARKGIPQYHNRRPSIVKNGITLYRCSKCLDFFLASDFYKNKRTILGLTSECRKCHSRTAIDSRDKIKFRKTRRESAGRTRKANPEKFRKLDRQAARKRKKGKAHKARVILNTAVKHGRIVKPSVCSECKSKLKLTAHHEDYNKPLEVIWLCYECHGKKHWID